MPKESPSSNGVWYFHLSLCPAGLSTLNFFLCQAVGLVGAAGAGAGRGRSGRWACAVHWKWEGSPNS